MCGQTLKDPARPSLVKPDLFPWLGIILHPEFAASYDPEQIAWMERLHWAIAWGILQNHTTMCRSN